MSIVVPGGWILRCLVWCLSLVWCGVWVWCGMWVCERVSYGENRDKFSILLHVKSIQYENNVYTIEMRVSCVWGSDCGCSAECPTAYRARLARLARETLGHLPQKNVDWVNSKWWMCMCVFVFISYSLLYNKYITQNICIVVNVVCVCVCSWNIGFITLRMKRMAILCWLVSWTHRLGSSSSSVMRIAESKLGSEVHTI